MMQVFIFVKKIWSIEGKKGERRREETRVADVRGDDREEKKPYQDPTYFECEALAEEEA